MKFNQALKLLQSVSNEFSVVIDHKASFNDTTCVTVMDLDVRDVMETHPQHTEGLEFLSFHTNAVDAILAYDEKDKELNPHKYLNQA